MSRFRPVWIHRSMRAEEQSRRRLASLLTGEMDHAFHYRGVKQSELWLEVHRRHAPLFVDPSITDIYRAIAAETAEALAGKAIHVIGLGPGGGEKEAWLLQALRHRDCRLRYTPVDASLELALLSTEAAEPFVETEILPVVGDLSLLTEFSAWLEQFPSQEARLYTAFGLTPNFLPSRIFPWLAKVLREQDCLLLSANLAPVGIEQDNQEAYRIACQAILPQYDNAETRAWLKQVLVDWGIGGEMSEPRFHVEPIEDTLGFVAYCAWLADVTFPWEGRNFRAQPGDRLRLFFSLRYTPRRLAEALKRHGLALGSGHLAPSRQEGVWRVGLIGSAERVPAALTPSKPVW